MNLHGESIETVLERQKSVVQSFALENVLLRNQVKKLERKIYRLEQKIKKNATKPYIR